MSTTPVVEIHITMGDGTVWAVPAHLVAHNRASYYADDPDSSYEAEYAFTMGDDYELTDWAAGNMNWEDVAASARKVSDPPPPNFQQGWVNGEKRVVRP